MNSTIRAILFLVGMIFLVVFGFLTIVLSFFELVNVIGFLPASATFALIGGIFVLIVVFGPNR